MALTSGSKLGPYEILALLMALRVGIGFGFYRAWHAERLALPVEDVEVAELADVLPVRSGQAR